MKRFGDTLRHLMELKGVTGVQLSAETGLTTTSISRLLNGQTRPRQVTLTRLMKYLCETKAEEAIAAQSLFWFRDTSRRSRAG